MFSLSVLFAVVSSLPVQRRDDPQIGDVLEPMEESQAEEEDTKEYVSPILFEKRKRNLHTKVHVN